MPEHNSRTINILATKYIYPFIVYLFYMFVTFILKKFMIFIIKSAGQGKVGCMS